MKTMEHVIAACVACALAFAAAEAQAQTLYKLIDKNGKVTYAEKPPPKDYDGKVIRMDINPNQNTATLPTPSPDGFQVQEDERKAAANRVRSAREKLDAARKELEDARTNPRDGDVTFIGNKGGGTRPVPSESYKQRLEILEARVKEAEKELRAAEGGS